MDQLLIEIVKRLGIVDPNDRLFLPYLVVTIIIAFVILRRRDPRGALKRLFPAAIFLHRSTKQDLIVGLINGLLFFTYVGFGSAFAFMIRNSLISVFGESSAEPAGPLALFVLSAAILAFSDIGNFVEHYCEHKIPLLWEFHKTHHSAEVLTAATVFREHPLSRIFRTTVMGAIVSIPIGIYTYLYKLPSSAIDVVIVHSFIAAYYTIWLYHFYHSHIWILFPKPLRRWLTSPAYHMIHHSSDPKHFDKNFAFIFAFLDRWAGTLYIPEEDERDRIVLGLGTAEQEEFQTMKGFYFVPFRNAWQIIASRTTSLGGSK